MLRLAEVELDKDVDKLADKTNNKEEEDELRKDLLNEDERDELDK